MNEIGRITSIGIGKEATFGTKASSITYFPVESFAPGAQTEVVREQGIFGKKATSLKGQCVAKKWSEPSLEGIVYDEVIGLFLLGTLGTHGKAGVAVPYTHTFTENDGTVPSFTIVWKDGAMTKMMTGCVFSSLEFTQETGGFLMFSASLVGKYPTTTVETPGLTAENKFCSKFASVKLEDAVAGLPAGTAINAESFSVSIEKNAEAKYIFGTNEPSSIYDKNMEITGEFTLNVADDSYLTLHSGGAIKAIQFDTINTDVTIGAGNPAFKIILDACDIQEWTRNGGKDERVTQTCGFYASYDLTAGSSIKAEIKNSKATDY